MRPILGVLEKLPRHPWSLRSISHFGPLWLSEVSFNLSRPNQKEDLREP